MKSGKNRGSKVLKSKGRWNFTPFYEVKRREMGQRKAVCVDKNIFAHLGTDVGASCREIIAVAEKISAQNKNYYRNKLKRS